MIAKRPSTYMAVIYPLTRRADGRFEGELTEFGGPALNNPQTPTVTAPIPRIIFDRDGSPADTVANDRLTLRPRASSSMPSEALVGRARVRELELPRFWGHRGAVGRDSVFLPVPVAGGPGRGTLAVVRVTPSGDTVFHRTFAYTPRPVDLAFREGAIQARMESFRAQADDMDALERAVRAMTRFGEMHPPVSALTVAEDGVLWLRRAPDEPDVTRWLLLEPTGHVRGNVRAPPGARLLWSEGAVAYLIEEDEFRVPWIVRYRMEPPRDPGVRD